MATNKDLLKRMRDPGDSSSGRSPLVPATPTHVDRAESRGQMIPRPEGDQAGTALAIATNQTPSAFVRLLETQYTDLYRRLASDYGIGPQELTSLTVQNTTDIQRMMIGKRHEFYQKLEKRTSHERSCVYDLLEILVLAFLLNAEETKSARALQEYFSSRITDKQLPQLVEPKGWWKNIHYRFAKVTGKVDPIKHREFVLYERNRETMITDEHTLEQVRDLALNPRIERRARYMNAITVATDYHSTHPDFIPKAEEVILEFNAVHQEQVDMAEFAIVAIGLAVNLLIWAKRETKRREYEISDNLLIRQQQEEMVINAQNYDELMQGLSDHASRLPQLRHLDMSTYFERNKLLYDLAQIAFDMNVPFYEMQSFVKEHFSYSVKYNPLREFQEKENKKDKDYVWFINKYIAVNKK